MLKPVKGTLSSVPIPKKDKPVCGMYTFHNVYNYNLSCHT